jgi:glycosyltransferase involved in cell wall biosynthesis
VKGIEILIEAVIQSQIPNIKLLLVGNDQTDYVNRLRAEYKMHSNIIFTGKQAKVQNFLSVADVFVIPTKNEGKREGMPMAPVEAMAMGIPVIGSRIAGIEDILEGFDEWLFEASYVEGLKNLLEKAYQLPKDDLLKIGMQMHYKVMNSYNLSKFITASENFYKKIYHDY